MGVGVNRESMSGPPLASSRVGMMACQAVHVAAACRCTAEPTPSPPIRSGRWKSGERDISACKLRPVSHNLFVEADSFLERHESCT